MQIDNTKQKEKSDFEETLLRLEELVSKIEAGNLSLEVSLMEFEKGIQLSRDCQQTLKSAEHRVRIISEDKESRYSPKVDCL